MWRPIAILAATAALGCAAGSGSDSDGGGGSGSVPTTPGAGSTDVKLTNDPLLGFTGVEAISFVTTASCPASGADGAFTAVALALEVEGRSGQCARVTAGEATASMAFVRLVLIRKLYGGTAPPAIRTGDYAYGGSALPAADGAYEVSRGFAYRYDTYDYGCFQLPEWSDIAYGTFHIAAADASGVSGSMALAVNGGGQLSGSFSTVACGITAVDPCTGVWTAPAETICLR